MSNAYSGVMSRLPSTPPLLRLPKGVLAQPWYSRKQRRQRSGNSRRQRSRDPKGKSSLWRPSTLLSRIGLRPQQKIGLAVEQVSCPSTIHSRSQSCDPETNLLLTELPRVLSTLKKSREKAVPRNPKFYQNPKGLIRALPQNYGRAVFEDPSSRLPKVPKSPYLVFNTRSGVSFLKKVWVAQKIVQQSVRYALQCDLVTEAFLRAVRGINRCLAGNAEPAEGSTLLKSIESNCWYLLRAASRMRSWSPRGEHSCSEAPLRS